MWQRCFRLACYGLFFSFLAVGTEGQSSHRCFVCASKSHKFADNQELRKMFAGAKIPKCGHYHRSRKHEFIQHCPKESRGCLTKFKDGSTMRTCAPISLEDCKVANDVTYCYCKTDLCNSPDQNLADPSADLSLEITNDVSNDEKLEIDVDNGSGDDPLYPTYGDDEDDSEYGDNSDMTEPPPFIVDETEIYRKKVEGDGDDFGFDDNNDNAVNRIAAGENVSKAKRATSSRNFVAFVAAATLLALSMA